MELYYENYTIKINFLKFLRALAFAIRLLPLEFLKSISPASFYSIRHIAVGHVTCQPECFSCEAFRLNFFEPNIFAAYFFQVVIMLSKFQPSGSIFSLDLLLFEILPLYLKLLQFIFLS